MAGTTADRPIDIDISSNDYSSVLRSSSEWFESLDNAHSLRISVSSVAALTGYHEFAAKDFSSKFLHLLYQDAWDQQRVDCAAVGIHLVDEKEEIEKLVKNASPARRKMKTAIIETKMGKVSSKKDMSKVLEESTKSLEDAVVQGKMTKNEARLVKDYTTSEVYKSFGITWEDVALDEYERRYRCTVHSRNENFKLWKFYEEEGEGGRGRWDEVVEAGRRRRSDNDATNDNANNGDDNTTSTTTITTTTTNTTTTTKTTRSTNPLFYLIGIADGIKDEMFINPDKKDLEDEFDDGLDFKPVIIECKHRMTRYSQRFYEVIQVVIYMLMHGADEGDLVEVLRGELEEGTEEEEEKNNTETKTIVEEKPPTNININVTRMKLRDHAIDHEYNLRNSIVPRLYDAARAVFRTRGDAHLRYRLLMAIAGEDCQAQQDFFEEVGLGDWIGEVGLLNVSERMSTDHTSRRKTEAEKLHQEGTIVDNGKKKKKRRQQT
ncbi:hypothetical protein TrST_g7722 [Triparma strigata]|uniref:Uncharacterized protein n=1 Tax=Triparma strigata TaxID=1606541 RepID=A0A9W6ZV80_9STRA|nr:hypothetical protein TrST_g7722 [Triparma strigata]